MGPTFAEFWMRLGARHDLVGSVFTRRTARCRVVVERRGRAIRSVDDAQQQQQEQQRQWTDDGSHY